MLPSKTLIIMTFYETYGLNSCSIDQYVTNESIEEIICFFTKRRSSFSVSCVRRYSTSSSNKDAYSSTEKYWKQNKCPLCPYITGSNPHYIDHLMGHVTGPSIQCPVCRRCFASKYSVQEHLLFHTKGNPTNV
ncbi:hypothetical protein CEXT_3811 [Caerostris extrusa]|uniref:C2H2-type domain-containing protein n=1 Tax=Caerostris extrusa TaxID=172846 RepID=A0AAV4QHA8_CAEEX|nr:hypothetical protein CEXT_3811 [Caerostris extrusa]